MVFVEQLLALPGLLIQSLCHDLPPTVYKRLKLGSLNFHRVLDTIEIASFVPKLWQCQFMVWQRGGFCNGLESAWGGSVTNHGKFKVGQKG